MSLIADGFLVIAALVATAYCVVLSRRLSRLNGLQGGLGAAIISLSERADAMNAALAESKRSTESAAKELAAQTALADGAANRLNALLDEAVRSGMLEAREDPVPEEVPADEVQAPDAPGATEPEEAAHREAGEGAANALEIIRDAPGAEEDDAFAMRLVDALSALQPGPRASA